MGVFRVWQFLDSWGIINYQAGAGAADDTDGLPLTVQPAGDKLPAWSCQHHAWLHLPVRANGHAWHLDVLQPQQNIAVQSYTAMLLGTSDKSSRW